MQRARFTGAGFQRTCKASNMSVLTILTKSDAKNKCVALSSTCQRVNSRDLDVVRHVANSSAIAKASRESWRADL